MWVSAQLIDKGVAALRAGNTATARRVFELAVTECESGAALEGLAEALYLQQEYYPAAAHYSMSGWQSAFTTGPSRGPVLGRSG